MMLFFGGCVHFRWISGVEVDFRIFKALSRREFPRQRIFDGKLRRGLRGSGGATKTPGVDMFGSWGRWGFGWVWNRKPLSWVGWVKPGFLTPELWKYVKIPSSRLLVDQRYAPKKPAACPSVPAMPCKRWGQVRLESYDHWSPELPGQQTKTVHKNCDKWCL